MIERRIGLSAFIGHLSQIAQTGPQDFDRIAQENIVFPPHAIEPGVRLITPSFYGRAQGLHLDLSADFILPNEELHDTLQGALKESRRLILPNRKFKAGTKRFWTTEELLAEQESGPFKDSKTDLYSYANTIYPDQIVLFGQHRRTSRAEAVIEDNSMTIHATGIYEKQFRSMANLLRPDIAVVRLSESDRDIILRQAEQTQRSDKQIEQLRRLLQARQRDYVSIDSGAIMGTDDVILINLRAEQIPGLEKLLNINLYEPESDQISSVVRLRKTYNRRTGQKNRFKDLKDITKLIQGMDLGPAEGFAISPEQALGHINKEVNILYAMYSDEANYLLRSGGNMSFRGDAVRRLASGMLGVEVTDIKAKLSDEEYVEYLTSKGYKPVEFETNQNLSARPLRERHLLQFYIQAAQQDPNRAIELYRKEYRYTPPVTTIDAEKFEDGSRINALDIPTGGSLFSLKVNEVDNSTGQNSLSFGKLTPGKKETSMRIKADINGSELLPLQDWVSNKIGITFSV